MFSLYHDQGVRAHNDESVDLWRVTSKLRDWNVIYLNTTKPFCLLKAIGD